MHPNVSHLYATTPNWLDAFFVLTTLLTAGILFIAIRQVSVTSGRRFLIAGSVWLAILGVLAYYHVFLHLDARPPAFVLVIGLPLLLIGSLFVSVKGRAYMSQLPLSTLTFLHTVRIPVELILYSLYLQSQIPQLMTFEGRNYDILAGLTAPIVAYFAFRRTQLSTRWLLIWNLLALGLVLNIVINAILSAPLPFQQFAFDQPNVAILKAPYVWLPGFIVPAVLFSHAVAIHRLINSRRSLVDK